LQREKKNRLGRGEIANTTKNRAYIIYKCGKLDGTQGRNTLSDYKENKSGDYSINRD